MTQFAKRLFVCALFSLVLAPHVLHGRAAQLAPPLPAPTGTVVNVSTEAQLQTAVQQLASNTTILIAPGTYVLTQTLSLNGTFTNVAIRGRTDNRDDVVLQGPGMANASYGNVPSGIWTGRDVQGVTIANLTIRDVFDDAIVFTAGTQNPHVYNVHLIDAGAAFVKSNPDGRAGGVNNGILEYSVIEYTATARDDGGNGVDVQTGANWIVRHNLFRNLVAPAGHMAGPAVVAWNSSTNSVTEGNTFLNCTRAIAYGLEDKPGGFDHSGGIIRNNFVYRSSAQPGGVGIDVADSPNTQVLNNTVFLSGTYATPIEYRFAGTTGVLLANNLLDGFLWARDGATGNELNNLGGATADMFVDAAAGDLHLAPTATGAIDHGIPLTDVTDDWDGQPRPSGAAQDIGADEILASDAGIPRASKSAPDTSSASGGASLAVAPGSVTAAAPVAVSIWNASAAPSRIEITDTNALELGLRFRADTDGTITGVRFYKGISNVGTHVGNLWTNGGTLLATATFTGETLSGWQQVMFNSPVAIAANTTYVVSYHSTLGQYGIDDSYFAATGVDNAPLHALADGVGGANGVYAYGASAFPTQTFHSSNYWVDVLFIATAGDTTAPTVSITAPASGATLSGSVVTVSETAADDVGVAGVQLKLDGANLGAEDTTGPYTQTWNTTTTTNGTHTLTAVARDAAGNTTTSTPVTVTVNNADTVAPAVSITAPASGATISGSAVTISATATDNVGVAGVQFKLDGANLGAEDTTGPYTQTWNTTTTTNGTHTLTAVARDAAGNTTTSTPVTVTVNNADTVAPAVSITAPASGATISGSAVTVSATATDNVGVAGVQFKLDGANLGAEDTTGPYTQTWNTTTTTNGTHTLTAVARDAAGNTTTSTPVTVTVNNADTVAPAVSITAPASGATISGSAVTVSATATDNVGVAGVQFKLDGANLGAEDTTGPYTQTWNTTTTTNGTHTLTAVARDAAGNTTTSTPVTVTVNNADTVAPAVSITAPASGATISGSAVTISATATDNIGVVGVQFKLDGANLGAEDTAAPYSIAWNTTTTPNGSHTVTAVARDAAGNTATSAAVTVVVSNAVASSTIWNGAATPSRIETSDTNAVELGVRFRADTDGTITGVRFYKGASNTGTHVGNLWTNGGILLATATFANETASGWQQVTFSSGVAITANTTYVASYHTTVGQYGADDSYFATGVDNAPLHALADGVDGANGLYKYGPSAFPTQSYLSSNYWVDVVFAGTSGGGDTTAPTVSIAAPASGATVSGSAVTVSANATDNVSVVGVQFKLDGANLGAEHTTAPFTQMWDTTTAVNGTHTLTAVARDAAGNATTSTPVTVTVSNADAVAPTVSITAPANGATVSGSAVTVSATATDNVGVVGVQFKLDGVNLGAEDTTSPYAQTWDTTTVVNGSHTLVAVARDAAGNTGTSSITVTVGNAASGPPTTVIFQASTDHDNGVTSYLLEAFASGADPNTASPVASSDLGKPTPAANGDITVDRTSFFSGMTPGTYVFTVSAIAPGGKGRSAPITVTW